MNRSQKFGFVLMAVAAVTPLILDAIAYRRMARIAESVNVELQKEMDADRYAKGIVRAHIYGEGYEHRPIDPSEDFEFYRIAYLEK